jgi:hypothetical protein
MREFANILSEVMVLFNKVFRRMTVFCFIVCIVWALAGCSSNTGSSGNNSDGDDNTPPGTGTGDKPTSFQENFEDGDYNGWDKNYPVNTVPERYHLIIDTPGANGTTYCIFLQGGRDKTYWDGIHTITPDAVKPNYVGFYAKTAFDTTTAGCFEFTTGSSPVPGLSFQFNRLKKIVVNGTECADYQANKWYHVEFKDIDWTTRTFNFYLDGNLITSNLTIPSSSYSLGDISLFNTDENSQAWWDELLIQW